MYWMKRVVKQSEDMSQQKLLRLHSNMTRKNHQNKQLKKKEVVKKRRGQRLNVNKRNKFVKKENEQETKEQPLKIHKRKTLSMMRQNQQNKQLKEKEVVIKRRGQRLNVNEWNKNDENIQKQQTEEQPLKVHKRPMHDSSDDEETKQRKSENAKKASTKIKNPSTIKKDERASNVLYIKEYEKKEKFGYQKLKRLFFMDEQVNYNTLCRIFNNELQEIVIFNNEKHNFMKSIHLNYSFLDQILFAIQTINKNMSWSYVFDKILIVNPYESVNKFIDDNQALFAKNGWILEKTKYEDKKRDSESDNVLSISPLYI